MIIWTFSNDAALEGFIRDDEWQKRPQIIGSVFSVGGSGNFLIMVSVATALRAGP
jgi:hypothetical protein